MDSAKFTFPLNASLDLNGFALITLTINLDKKNQNSTEKRNALMPVWSERLSPHGNTASTIVSIKLLYIT